MTKLTALGVAVRTVLSILYRFKPGRTFAQALSGALALDGATTGILDTNLPAKAAIAGSAALVSFLMIWAEGGDMLADDKRVTGTKPPGEAGGYWAGV